MFRVKSSFKTELEIKAPSAKIKDFFSDLTNFTELLAGVESIRREPGGIVRWTIATETPVGRVRLSLPVRETSPHADTIEWSPALNEADNPLRYSLKFEQHTKATQIHISQHVSLRRLHSTELQRGVRLLIGAKITPAL